MGIATPLTRLLGIEYPILLAPMAFVSGGALAAAVTRAGGLGFVGGGYGDADWLARELAAAGDARTGVGFITWSLDRRPELLDLALDRRPAAIWLSFGDIAAHAGRIKRAGCLLVAQVQTVRAAREAAASGADLLVAQGTEAGGHGHRRATLPLVPSMVDAVAPVPVVAAGGIADGRGLAAALMLGADGVAMGTAFYAATEALAHPAAKQTLVAASGDDTSRGSVFDAARRITWPEPWTLRALDNGFSRRWQGDLDALRGDAAELARYEAARAAGDFTVAGVLAGEAADLVRTIEPAAGIVRRVGQGAERLLAAAPQRLD
ncbi:MAG: NAD(P)H-dependent flavin oxidoreductase [Geminicoccaceae bacterium]